MAKFSKKYQNWKKNHLHQKDYLIEEAIKILQKEKIEKFDPSLNLLFHLNLNPKKPEHNLKKVYILPHPLLKPRKICVFTKDFQDEAQLKKPFLVGGKELIEAIKVNQKIDFDLALATPEIMPELNKIGKLLGTKKLMPSVKNNTLDKNIANLIAKWQQGQQVLTNDSYGNVSFVIGKFSTKSEKLLANFNFCLNTILKIKPTGVKGKYLKRISLSSTMGPGLKIVLKR